MPFPVSAALTALSVALLATGCHIEEGSGHFGEQVRLVGTFDRVIVDGDFDHVWVEHCADCAPVAIVRGDDNLIGEVAASSSGSQLRLRTRGWLIPTLPLEVIVRGPLTTRVELSGSSIVTVDAVDPARFDAEVSGSGDLGVRGATAHFDAEVSGSGAVRAFDLKALTADVDISGSGTVEVCASEQLAADVSGSGAVYYTCDPNAVRRNISGSGAIRRR